MVRMSNTAMIKLTPKNRVATVLGFLIKKATPLITKINADGRTILSRLEVSVVLCLYAK
jgi:hypothetical protein